MGIFIDEQGVSWESVREHDLAITAGRYADAVREAELTDAEQFPNPWQIAREVCVDPENIKDAADEAIKARLFDSRLRRLFQ